MKPINRFSTLAIAVVLLLVSAIPAFASTELNFEIRNRTQSTVNLILRGPTDVDVSVRAGNQNVRLEPGLYVYRYVACGHRNSGSFTFSTVGQFLLLRKCEKGLNATITIVNKTGHTFALDLFGTHHYALTIKPGDNKMTLLAGPYQYSTNACGGPLQKGTHKLKSGSNPDWVFDC